MVGEYVDENRVFQVLDVTGRATSIKVIAGVSWFEASLSAAAWASSHQIPVDLWRTRQNPILEPSARIDFVDLYTKLILGPKTGNKSPIILQFGPHCQHVRPLLRVADSLNVAVLQFAYH